MNIKAKYLLLFSVTILISLLFVLFNNLLEKYPLNFIYNLLKFHNTEIIDLDLIKNRINNKYQNYDVLSYKLNLDINLTSKQICSTCKLRISLKNQKKIFINFRDNFKIHSLKIGEHIYKYDYQKYGILLNGEFKDTTEIVISYEGKPQFEGYGGFVFDTQFDTTVYTLNEPVFASTWFPCKDNPTDKALFDISIKVDSSYFAVSTGNLISIENNQSYKVFRWKTNYPTSTYLVSLNIGKYVVEELESNLMNGFPKIIFYTFPNDMEKVENDFRDIKNIINAYNNLFGNYPFVSEKLGIVEIAWPFGAIENQTSIGFSYHYYSGINLYKNVIAHELAHQWWGNSVTVKEWEDIWLFEGLSTYSEALFYEYESDKRALYSSMESIRNFETYSKLYKPEGNLFSDIIYNKSAWIFHMLRGKLGDEKFFEVLKNIQNKYKYLNLSTFDLIDEFGKSQITLEDFFYDWVFESKYKPRIEFGIVVEGKNSTLLIKQSQKDILFNLDLQFIIKYNENDMDILNTKISESEKVIILPSYPESIDISDSTKNWLLCDFIKISN